MEGKAYSDEGKPCQSPGRMKNSSYYIAPVGVRTHDLPHTVASNMGKVSYALTHLATAAVKGIINIFVGLSQRLNSPSAICYFARLIILLIDRKNKSDRVTVALKFREGLSEEGGSVRRGM